jgi:hypothetical protein
MIIFLTTAAYTKVLKSLAGPGYGAPLPEIRVASYEEVLRRSKLPVATYVFSDLERLSHAELRAVSSLHVALAAAGLRVLNNPARVRQRYELLRELFALGLNPFNVHRADDRPRPGRFPVFLRFERGHAEPNATLLHDQAELDAELARLQQMGEPLKGMLIVECVPSDTVDGRWHKWGAFCIGGVPVLDHIAVEDRWMVKVGRWEHLTPRIVTEEHSAVSENRHADYVRAMFAIAAIDFGRADFALAGGKPMLFEINTAPIIHDLGPDPHLLRQDTMKIARQAFAAALHPLDTAQKGTIEVPATPILASCRSTPPAAALCHRP